MSDPLLDIVQTRQNDSIAVGRTNRDDTLQSHQDKRDLQHIALASQGQKIVQPDWVRT